MVRKAQTSCTLGQTGKREWMAPPKKTLAICVNDERFLSQMHLAR